MKNKKKITIAFVGGWDYQGAQRQLELADEKKLLGLQRVVYWADCAYVAFYLGENDKALAYLAKKYSFLTNEWHRSFLIKLYTHAED